MIILQVHSLKKSIQSARDCQWKPLGSDRIRFFCLVLLLAACSSQPAVSPTASSTPSQAADTASVTTSDTPVPAPTRTQPQASATSTAGLPTQSPTAKSTEPPQPTATGTPAFAPPVGEIAYFDLLQKLHLRDVRSYGSDRQVYESFHDKQPDLNQGISWSPDGSQVAFAMTPWSDIYLLTIGEQDAVNLTKTDNAFEMDPAISPNGKLIAFVSDRRKVKGGRSRDLYSMRLNGGGARLLLECQVECRSPEWSPDGKQLVFQMGNDLYVMPARGGKPERLAAGGVNQFPAWSPDGQWVAFLRLGGFDSPGFIYIIRPDGSGVQALTDASLRPWQLTWSPDSQFIAFENVSAADQLSEVTIKAIHLQSGAVFDLAGPGRAPAWRLGEG